MTVGLGWLGILEMRSIFNWPSLGFVVLLLTAALSGAGAAETGLRIAWTNNILAITSPQLPGGRIDTWYLEAFCRSQLS